LKGITVDLLRSAVTPIGADPQKGQVSYDISAADRAGIVAAYQTTNGGRMPSEAEIQARYHLAMVRKGYVR